MSIFARLSSTIDGRLCLPMVLHYSSFHMSRKSTDAARWTNCDMCDVMCTGQLLRSTLRVVRYHWLVLRPCATVHPTRVANRPRLRVGRYATRLLSRALANYIGRRFASAEAMDRCGVSILRACAEAHTLTHSCMPGRTQARTDVHMRTGNCATRNVVYCAVISTGLGR